MFDFNDNYTYSELTAIDNFMCYVRAKAAESVDLSDLRTDLNKEHRALSRVINARLDEAAEEWDRTKQARDHEAVEAEKVDRIVQACVAGAPPAEEPDDHSDLWALVNILSRCSDQLTALALVEDRHFEESSEMDAFIKSTVLRNANRSIIDMLADIRDHFREVLSDD